MNNPIPQLADNPHGLHRRYNVTKADGSPVDPRAIYFVLRLDQYGDDQEHTKACRQAARVYAHNAPMNLAKMSIELKALVNQIEFDLYADPDLRDAVARQKRFIDGESPESVYPGVSMLAQIADDLRRIANAYIAAMS